MNKEEMDIIAVDVKVLEERIVGKIVVDKTIVDKRTVLTVLSRSCEIGCLCFKFLYKQVEAQVCNVLDFVISRAMYESMCTHSKLSENFPIVYKIDGWVNCGHWLWMNVSWMSFLWIMCGGWCLVNM